MVALLTLQLTVRPGALSAQEPEVRPDSARRDSTVAGAGAGNCVLTWESTSPDTRSLSERVGDDLYTTYIGGGMLWTCGTATMEADSAVKYDLARRVELYGNVRYRDTIRTLASERLTYHEIPDRIVATDSVLLTRLGSGSTLRGPFVEFLRAVSGVNEQTIARDRPHMTLYAERDDPGPPFEVDADVAIFAGEEEARARGDVIIERPDLRAEADSALFLQLEGRGVLWGDPWVEAEQIRLRGDTIRTAFTEQTLSEVHAEGAGHAQGESFEVAADRIDVTVADEEVEAVWAYGFGISLPVSGSQVLWGDSLRFAMFAGRLDSVIAVGDAAALDEGGEEPPTLERFRNDDGAPRATPEFDPAPADSGAVEPADPAVAGSVRATDDRPGSPPDGTRTADRYGPPELMASERGNWVNGDTLWAVFRRLREVDTAGAAVPPPEDDDPVIERLTVSGSARAYYAQVRDSSATSKPSRNYMIGERIDVLFVDGQPDDVIGVKAIGVYLEPDDAGGSDEPATGPVVPAARDSAGTRDTTAAPPDSTAGGRGVPRQPARPARRGRAS